MRYTPTELARIRALSDVLHAWVHDPECDDPACIVGVYTAEEIAYSVVLAGWVPAQTTPMKGFTTRVGLSRARIRRGRRTGGTPQLTLTNGYPE